MSTFLRNTYIANFRANIRLVYIALCVLFSTPVSLSQNLLPEHHPATGAKDFRRTEQFISNRADINGSMHPYTIMVEKATDSLRKYANSARSGSRNKYRDVQFYPLGPFKATDSVLAQLGLVSALWIDSTDFQTIYAGSNTGGFFATYDGGQNWHCKSDNYMTTGVMAIEVDPKDKQHIYIGTGHWGFYREWGQGIMQSFDGGNTWQNTSINAGISTAGFVVHDIKHLNRNTDTLIAVLNTEFRGGTCIYLSPDRGTTWELVYQRNKEELFDIVKDPFNHNRIFAVGSLYLRSDDGGRTWDDLTQNIKLDENHKIARVALTLSPHHERRLVAMVESYDTVAPGNYGHWLLISDLYSNHRFERLKYKFIPFVSYWKMELAFSPTNPDEFYLGGIWFYRYKLEGDSARIIRSKAHKYHKDVRDLLVFKGSNGKDLLYMGNDGGVSRSDDNAYIWRDISNGLQATQFYNIAIGDKSNMVFCGPQDGNHCFYNYETGNWSIDTHIGDAYEGLVDYDNPKNVYIVTYPPKSNRKNIFLLKSIDGGLTFNYKGVPDTTEQGRNNIPIAMDAVNPKILYAGLKNVWKSTDGAETWTRISNFNNPHKLQAVEVSPSDPEVICVSFENPAWSDVNLQKIMITTNGGQKWTDITPRGTYNLQWVSCVDILIHPDKPANIYLALDRIWQNNRIYVTHDGGRTWDNFSQGLPNVPVSAIKYLKGAGYDILFAATDAGIFFRDEFMQQWEVFGEGLPITIISDIDFNYAKKKIVAGTFGRGLWEADFCLPLDDSAMVIDSKVNWQSGKNLLSDLILLPGAQLTMTGTIEVGDNRVIRVMPGAHLILDNAVLTNNCKTFWQGIELYGHVDYNSDNPQGRISMIHGATIQNSFRGIETFAMDESGKVDSLKGGGIIYTNRANFKNVLHSIILKPTMGINPSKFILAEFAIKNPPWEGYNMSELVKMTGNRGIDFISCTFRNDTPYSQLPTVDRGIGINSYNSSFRIYRIATDSVPIGLSTKPLFYQLNTAVKALTATPGYTFYTNNVTYKNNLTGCYLSGYSSISSVDNSYELTSLTYPDTTHKVITGLYLDHVPSYEINGNNFRYASPFGMSLHLAGIVVNNCGELNNLISNNKFDKITYSILAQNKNRNSSGSRGLRILNNNFIKNAYDIAVTIDSTQNINGIAYFQGQIGNQLIEPAGNKFSNNKLFRTGDLHNEGSPIIYSHYLNTPAAPAEIPVMSGNIWLMTSATGKPGDSTHKPTYVTVDTSQIDQLRYYWQQNLAETMERSENFIDGGYTSDLLAEIKNCNATHTTTLYKKLRTLDSKLSPAVLHQLVKNNRFPNTLLIEVLIENPIIFRHPAILQDIYKRSPAMPAFMMQRFNGLFTRYSSSEIYQSDMENAQAIYDAMLAIKLNKTWTHPYTYQGPGIDSLLNQESDPAFAVMRAFAYYRYNFTTSGETQFSQRIKKGEINSAVLNGDGNPENSDVISILNECITQHPDIETSIHNLMTLMEIDESLILSGADTLTTEQYNLLNAIASDSIAGIYARNIINFFYNSYPEIYLVPTALPSLMDFELPAVNIIGNHFRIYPQPATDYFIIDYLFESGFDYGSVELINTAGQIMKTIPLKGNYGQAFVNLSGMHPGLYLARLLNESNTTIGFYKVLVIK